MSNWSYEERVRKGNELLWKLQHRNMSYRFRNDLYSQYKRYISLHLKTDGNAILRFRDAIMEPDILIRKTKVWVLFGLS